MPTSIEIASNALVLIGDEPINTFIDQGSGAEAANALFDPTYEALLSSFKWSFALKDFSLVLSGTTPDPLTGYQYAYDVPTDLIRLWEIAPVQTYEIREKLIYSNINSGALASYIYKISESFLPPHFVEALTYKLAADFAIAVTEDEDRNALFTNKFLDSVKKARHIDSQQAPQKSIVRNPIRDVRFGGYTPGYGGF